MTASPKHHERLRSLGATEVFDYKDPDVASKIKEASGGKIQYGVDCISENGPSVCHRAAEHHMQSDSCSGSCETGTTKTAAQAFSDDGGKLATLRERGPFRSTVTLRIC